MISKRISVYLLCAGLIGLASAAFADDTDIYNDPTVTTGSALVMFTLDNRSNTTSTYGGCSQVGEPEHYCTAAQYFADQGLASDLPASNKPLTFLDALRLALKVALSKLPADSTNIKIGLMLNHNLNKSSASLGSNTGDSLGAYVDMGFTSLADNGAGILDTKLKAVRKYGTDTASLGSSGTFNGHNYQGMALFYEFYHYLTGYSIWAAHQGYADYNKSVQGNNAKINLDAWVTANYPATTASNLVWDTSVEGVDGNYVSPITSDLACGKIYTINLFFGNSQDGSAITGSNTSPGPIRDTVASGGMALPKNPTFEQAIAYLKGTDVADGVDGRPDVAGTQDVTSFFFTNGNLQNTVDGYAAAGGTGSAYEMGSDPAVLVEAFDRIFGQILSVSTTFVSASVPANVFNRAEITDNLFVALFQAEKVPYWTGNVKRLKLVSDANGNFTAYDALGVQAIDVDGRINNQALTFWTNAGGRDVLETKTLDEYQALTTTNRPTGTTGRDGRDTYRGGAGQNIPGLLDTSTPANAGDPGATNATSGARQMYYLGTDPGIGNTTSQALTSLDYSATPSAALQTKLGLSGDATTSAKVLSYIRGYSTDTGSGTSRRWMFSDPMHSRPLPLNYGTRGGYSTSNQAIYLAVGSNDGAIHFIKNTNTDGTASGQELWAFLPDEGLAIQKTLKDNNSSTHFQYGNSVHPYGVDGAPVSLMTTADGTPTNNVPTDGKVFVYFGLRRGGFSYYALDVSDPSAAPKLRWHISNATSGFSSLGLTFSRPQLGRLRYKDSSSNTQTVNILVFGGGYDYDHNDYYRNPSSSDTIGNAIYVVNAETGELIRKISTVDMTKSIPAEVTMADTDRDGYTDRIVVPDVGGNVWRVDMADDVDPSLWTSKKVASLGSDQHFFHAVDLVQTRDSTGSYDGVIVGSGDRSNPIDCAYDGVGSCTRTTPIVNYLYVIKDRDTAVRKDVSGTVTPAYSSAIASSDLPDITTVCTSSCTTPDFTSGWKLQLQASGEKALSTPFTFQGNIFLTTYIPTPSSSSSSSASCGPSEGSGRFYAVKLANGTASYNLNQSDTGSPAEGNATESDRYKELASGGIPAEVVYLENGHLLLPDLHDFDTESRAFLRTYWRREDR